MTRLEELIEKYPVRKSNKQKNAFREFVISEAASKGFDAKIEKTSDGDNDNIVIGDVENAKAVFTAHFDTPASSLFPNIMIPRNNFLFWLYQFAIIFAILAPSFAIAYLVNDIIDPDGSFIFMAVFLVLYYSIYFLAFRVFENKNNHNDNTSGVATVMAIIDGLENWQKYKVAFILFDNEEKGKKGSKAYYKDHEKYMKDKLLINFDCVGNGKNIIFIAMKDAEDKAEYGILKENFNDSEEFAIHFYPMKGSQSNSDYKNFPCGVGCLASKKGKKGLLYTPRIHTKFDTVADNKNIEYISEGVIDFVKRI